MSNTSKSGRHAEDVAAEYLEAKGFFIVDKNWRTRWCEIDIVAKKNERMFLVEVKYRHSSNQGTGTDYITSRKLLQMSRAAEIWVHQHDWEGEYQLAVIEVDGDEFEITNVILDLEG